MCLLADMIMKRGCLPCLVLCSLLSACAVPRPVVEYTRNFLTPPQGPPFARLADDPGMATVYFYRPLMPLAGLDLKIKVNDVIAAALPTDGYTVIRMDPGTHMIATDWGKLHNLSLSKTTSLTVVAGQSYFVTFTAEQTAFVNVLFTRTAIVTGELDKTPAELAACIHIEPRSRRIHAR